MALLFVVAQKPTPKKKGPPNKTGLSKKQKRKFYRAGVMPLLALPLGVAGLVAGSGP